MSDPTLTFLFVSDLKLSKCKYAYSFKLFILVCWGRSYLSVALSTAVQLVFVSDVVWRPGLSIFGQLIVSLSPRF